MTEYLLGISCIVIGFLFIEYLSLKQNNKHKDEVINHLNDIISNFNKKKDV